MMPKSCPVCGTALLKRNIGTGEEKSAAHFCLNPRCPGKDRRRLYYFTSKTAFDIEHLGPKIIDMLVDDKLVAAADDFFTLKKGDLLALPRFAEKSADNLLKAIEKARKITLDRFITALSISQVGEETAYDLARHFKSFEKFAAASSEELEAIEGVGPTVATAITSWFREPANRKLAVNLLGQVRISLPLGAGAVNNALSGKTFVLTGTMESLSRDEAKKRIKARGGDTSSSVSKKTDFVVAGENPGSKLAEARNLGIAVISEAEFLKMFEA